MNAYMPYIWIGVAVLMAIAEVTTVQLVSVWFVIGAVCAAVTTFFTDSLPVQLLVFAGVSLLALIITRPLVRRFKQKNKIISTNADRVIGETGVLLTDLTDRDCVGQIKVGGAVWSAKCDNPPLKKGDRARVLAIEGVKLIVEKTE